MCDAAIFFFSWYRLQAAAQPSGYTQSIGMNELPTGTLKSKRNASKRFVVTWLKLDSAPSS